MTLDKLDLLKVRAESFRRVLTQASESAKKNHVTKSTAEEFNRLLDEVATGFPEVADALPKKILASSRGPSLIGCVDVKLVELEILSEQLVGIIDLLISKR